MRDATPIDHHTALIYVMVLVSAADSNMTNAEMRSIGEEVQYLPIFRDFDRERLPKVASSCVDILNQENGLDQILSLIEVALPPQLRETAYALACDVAAADGRTRDEVLRMMEIIRDRLTVEPLVAVAIERAARARHQRI